MGDWHTHVFTSTYTSDVSGVCSMLYELGGMTVLHDPSGCNSTYTTHDEPRWYDEDSLMFISGLDEMGAVFGNDEDIIEKTVAAAETLHPRFITLCGASIPHIIAFDYRGVASLIEERTGIPVLAVKTDGLRSYVSGGGLAMKAWMERFALEREKRKNSVNILGVTPVDFCKEELVTSLKENFKDFGISINCTCAYGNTFEQLQNVKAGEVNAVVSSTGRILAAYLKRKAGIPYVEGLPCGTYMRKRIQECIREVIETGENRIAFDLNEGNGEILVIGEEIYAHSMVTEINHSLPGNKARALFPDVDEGIDEDSLLDAVSKARIVIADPLFQNCIDSSTTQLIPVPHLGYSGRMFIQNTPVYTAKEFHIESLFKGVNL